MRGITEPGVSRPRTQEGEGLSVRCCFGRARPRGGALGCARRVCAAPGAVRRATAAADRGAGRRAVEEREPARHRDHEEPARPGAPWAASAAALRAGDAAYQAPLMSELREVHATHVKSYRLVDSFAATVSAGEEARLKANPAVAEVIPDVTIRGRPQVRGGWVLAVAEAGARRTDASLTAQRDPRRLRPERQGPARSRGPGADGHRLGRPRPARPRARSASPAQA